MEYKVKVRNTLIVYCLYYNRYYSIMYCILRGEPNTKYNARRTHKALELAFTGKIRQEGKRWTVPSQSGGGSYFISYDGYDPKCTCVDFQTRTKRCKHIIAIELVQHGIVEILANEEIKKSKKVTYSQNWSAYNMAQSEELKLFDQLLNDLVSTVDEPVQIRERPRLSTKDALYCSILKVYSRLSSRRSSSLFEFAESRGQISHKPHFNVSSKFLNRGDVTPILQHLLSITAMPLKQVETKFATDSSGFRTRNFMQYSEEKYKLKRDHGWLKAHITCGVQTNIITALRITDHVGKGSADSPNFGPLMQETKKLGFSIEEASADKAYSSRNNIALIHEMGGVAYIPFKDNSTGRPKGANIWRKMYAMFLFNKEQFESHYHLRSNVETTFSAWKLKLGDSLNSRNPTAQRNELICKAIAYNITVLIHEMFELGIEPNLVDKPPAVIS